MQYRAPVMLALAVTVGACGEVKDGGTMADAAPPRAPDASPPGPPDATVRDCTPDSSRSQRDVNTGIEWRPLWFCNNVGGAMLYEGPSDGSTPEARMDTTYSWFVCWKRGMQHQGENDVWYYTQGDRKEPGSSHEMWGFMAAFNVMSSVHPHPGIVECP
jgi:hypothetical protein